MSDWYAPARQIPTQQPKRGERLFEFMRGSDRAPMSCELRDTEVETIADILLGEASRDDLARYRLLKDNS